MALFVVAAVFLRDHLHCLVRDVVSAADNVVDVVFLEQERVNVDRKNFSHVFFHVFY